MTETSDLVERMAWGRARVATTSALVFVATQAGSLHQDLPLNRPQTVQLAAWIVWALALCGFLAWSGGLFRGRRVRAVLNDKSTKAHRVNAMAWGFWAAIGAAFLVYFASFYDDGMTARVAVRLVITCGIVVALLRFGTLERKALKLG